MTAEQKSRRNLIVALWLVGAAMVVTFIRSDEFVKVLVWAFGG